MEAPPERENYGSLPKGLCIARSSSNSSRWWLYGVVSPEDTEDKIRHDTIDLIADLPIGPCAVVVVVDDRTTVPGWRVIVRSILSA